jgi:hypothetical protein
MSGQLVGEVIAASPALRQNGLSKNGFLALIAIAEKCIVRTRQGSVNWDHIRDGLYGVSKRTAVRAVRELKEAELIRVAAPGWANQHGQGAAPIYQMRIPTLMSSSSELDDDKSEVDDDKSEVDDDKSELDDDRHPPLTCDAPTLDGSIDGSIDGGRARTRANRPDPTVPDPRDAPPRANLNGQEPADPAESLAEMQAAQWADCTLCDADGNRPWRNRTYSCRIDSKRRAPGCPYQPSRR